MSFRPYPRYTPPVGLVLSLIDEFSEPGYGSGGIQDRIDEKIYRHFRYESPLPAAVGSWWQHANRNDPIWQALTSRGGGGPSVSPQPPPIASKRSPESRKASKTNSAHGFRKPKAVSARGKCPKGHYWSYKKKKCLKSKFR